MKRRILLTVCLVVLGPAGLSWSQVSPVPSSSAPPQNAAGNELQTAVVTLEYYPAGELVELLQSIFPEVTVTPDAQSNRVILTAPPARMKEIMNLIRELDVSNVGTTPTQSLLYRVFMLEIPSKGPELKPFTLVLERPSQWPSAELLAASKTGELQVGTMLQDNEATENGRWRLIIQGRAAALEVVKQMVEKLPESQLIELKWDEEMFTTGVAAAQVTRLPAQLQQYLRKFLGDDIQTVGYWFGSLSLPGEAEAPLGPWTLHLKARSAQGAALVMDIEVDRVPLTPFAAPAHILSNSIQSKIGKPIIVGYNRESYGTRKMGALVILPEADANQPDESPTRVP